MKIIHIEKLNANSHASGLEELIVILCVRLWDKAAKSVTLSATSFFSLCVCVRACV